MRRSWKRVRAGFAASSLAIACPEGSTAFDAAALADALAGVRWVRTVDEGTAYGPETTEWVFDANGAFRSSLSADFADRSMGAWSIAEVQSDSGMLLLADATRGRFDALSVTPLGDKLRLGESLFGRGSFQGARPTVPGESDLEALAPGRRERFFPLWLTLTSSGWQRTATSAENFEPDEFVFSQAGRYRARYSRGPCEFVGTWSLWSSAGRTGEIRLSVPSNACDPRGPRTAFVRGMPVRLDGERLFLHDGEYAPVSNQSGS